MGDICKLSMSNKSQRFSKSVLSATSPSIKPDSGLQPNAKSKDGETLQSLSQKNHYRRKITIKKYSGI